MSRTSSPLPLLLLVPSLLFSITALPHPLSADISQSLSLHLPPQNLSTGFGAPTTRPQSLISAAPLNFLGITCYHLKPDTVSLHSCQSLFAAFFSHGDVDHKYDLYNGYSAFISHEPCTITVASPRREDRRVKISFAEIVVHATEVLKHCGPGGAEGGTGTGGAFTFEGSWEVRVTREPIEFRFSERKLVAE